MNIHGRFLINEIRHGGKQWVTFILCVVLSISTLTALNSFKRDVHHALLQEARDLHGGDIIVRSSSPVSGPLSDLVDTFEKQAQLSQLKTYEFYSVIRPELRGDSVFVNIKAVDSGYPFYGTVTLLSGKHLSHVLEPGKAVVAQEVMERLGLRVGEKIKLGNSRLEIADVVTYESARPAALFSLGPRVFVSSGHFGLMELLTRGSRAQYSILLKIDNQVNIAHFHELLVNASVSGQEQVETAQMAPSRVKRFFDNLFFFLSFTSIFTLLLSGIGMQGTLSAILRQKQQTIAVAKAVGATNSFLLINYLIMVLILGFLGCLGGLMAAYGITYFFPVLFSGLLPVGMGFSFSPTDIVEGIALGLVVVFLFTFLPLYRLGRTKPAAIFRSEVAGPEGKTVANVAMACGFVFLSLLVIRQLEDVKIGILFMLGLLVLIVLASFAAVGLMWLLRKLPFTGLPLKQAVKSLGRPGNATRSITVTLASAFAVLLTILLLKLNIFAVYIESYPEDAPNLFCIDIQQDQEELFKSVIGVSAPLFPVIRAKLISVNSILIDRDKEKKRKSDNLDREFNLTYREQLLEDERIVAGGSLFGENPLPEGVVEVSVLDSIADIGKIGLGDRLRFSIQGVPVDAQVTSVRSRTKSKLYPFFYFVFKKQSLEAAPQTLFAALHLPKEDISQLISRVVTQMPNISTINVSDMAIQFGRLFKRLSAIISFFASFSIIAGLLILVSSILATRPDRLKEVSYYKVLGADTGFVFRVLVYENIILGLFCSLVAVCFAVTGSYLVCHYVFDIPYNLYWLEISVMVLVAVLLVFLVGLVSVFSTIRQKPAAFLSQQDGV